MEPLSATAQVLLRVVAASQGGNKEGDVGKRFAILAAGVGLCVLLLFSSPMVVLLALAGVASDYDQTVTEDYLDQDYQGTDYGDVTLDGVTYFNQTDARWGGIMYGKSGTIAQAGCGPTAVAIAVSTLSGRYIIPSQVARWSVQNGYRAEGSGSYHSLIPAAGVHYGLAVEGIGSDGDQLKEALERGDLVVALMSKGHFTNGGHFIVLRGITSEGKVLVADPSSLSRSKKAWDLDIILDECNGRSGSGGPFWVYSA